MQTVRYNTIQYKVLFLRNTWMTEHACVFSQTNASPRSQLETDLDLYQSSVSKNFN